ncbi:MAG: hypothetical protein ACRD02_12430 [Acidimicrobiia bacterium]
MGDVDTTEQVEPRSYRRWRSRGRRLLWVGVPATAVAAILGPAALDPSSSVELQSVQLAAFMAALGLVPLGLLLMVSTSARRSRLSGGALMIGGLAWTASFAVIAASAALGRSGRDPFVPAYLLGLVAVGLLLVGLPGLRARAGDSLLGSAGLVVTAIGCIPYIPALAGVLYVATLHLPVIGSLAFALSAVRSGAAPGPAALLVAASAGILASIPLLESLLWSTDWALLLALPWMAFGLAWSWWGARLARTAPAA